MNRRDLFKAGAGCAVAGLLPSIGADAVAADAYPQRAIHVWVGFPPGQATDIITRLLGERLSAIVGQPIVVENRPGSGGSLVLAALARQKADGYTIGMAATGAAITNLYLMKKPGYQADDFEPVALIGDLPLLLATRPGLPFDDVESLVAHAKRHPGRLTYSSPGNGTTSHLAMETFKRSAGIDMVHVPYPGSAKSLGDLIGGAVDLSFDTIATVGPYLQQRKLKLLAVGHRTRLPEWPDAATLIESGYPEIRASVWIAVLAPRQTPPNVIQALNAAFNQTLTEPAMQQRLQAMGAYPRPMSPSELAGFLRDENPRWKKIVEDSGAVVD